MIQQLTEEDDDLEANVEDDVDVFMAAEQKLVESSKSQGIAASKPIRCSGTIKSQSDHKAPQTNPSFIQW